MELKLPKTYNFGETEYIEVLHLEQTFGISRRTAFKYLRVLRIRPLYIGKDVFFSLQTLNRILFVLSKPGSPGFLFPGSEAKNRKSLREDEEFLTEVTNEIIEQAGSAQTLAEMAAASGRDSSMVKKLISQSNAQSRKEKTDA